jgi:hypothetical protein
MTEKFSFSCHHAQILLAALLLPLVSTGAHAQQCYSEDGPESCQAIVQTGDTAPAPTNSQGIRFNGGVTNVLFTSYGTSCRFADNNSGDDLFIPQNNSAEFNSFITNPPSQIIIANCVPPVSPISSPFKASASIAYPSFQLFAEGGQIVPSGAQSISIASNIAVPTDQSIGRVATATTPGSVTNVSSTSLNGSPIAFLYTRQDCRLRSDGTPVCNTRSLKEQQMLTFAAQPSNPAGNDGSWVPVNKASTYSIQNLQTGAWAVIAGPASDYEPPAQQSCTVGSVTYVNGQSWTASTINTQTPTASECPYGAGSQVDTMMTTTTYTCQDGLAVATTIGSPQEISASGTCAPSPFQTTDDSTGAHAFLYQLTPLSNRNGLQGQAGNVNLLTAANRITDVEFYATQIDVPDQDFSAGFPGYPNLNTWFGVCYDGGYQATVTGQYTFTTAADDGVAIWVDGVLLDDYEDNVAYSRITTNTGSQGNNMTPAAAPTITLLAGLHDIVVKYYQGWASNLGVQVWVQAPNQPQAVMQLVNPPNGVLNCPH